MICAVIGIHHVQVASPPGSEDASRAFYGELLGLTEIAKPPVLAARGGAWFRGGSLSGGVEVHLGIEADFRPARKAHPALVVTDLEALTTRLAAAGCPIDRDGALPGFNRCYVRDPHGNRIELVEPVTGTRH